ncbi:MAG: hypothetical protein J5792_02305 [Bacteroidales bacterium]|nr:hypothetical protein [Bacteroidales bacterium]
MNRIILFTWLIIGCLGLNGCKHKKEVHQPKTNLQEVKKLEKENPVRICRYEQALFNLPSDSLEEGLKKMRKDYDFFIGDNPSVTDLKAYLNDPVIKNLYKDVQQKYADISDLEKGFQQAFARLQYHFPNFKAPRIYTIVSGMDFESPIIYVDTVLIIALDMYLGADYHYYKQMGEYLPNFVRRHLSKEYILSDCMKALSYQVIHSNNASANLLDDMILEGKRWMFSEIALPDAPDSLICLYTADQLRWAEINEYDVWSFLIQKNYLYGNDNLVARKLIGETPYTAYFGNSSPGNLGSWLGWQICRSWIAHNPQTPVTALFEEKVPQKILKESQYKPIKK